MPRHSSRRVGAFRVRPVPDGADGCRDTGSGSGVPGPKRAAVQAEGTIRGPEKGACGRSGPQGREAFEKANRTEQTGAGIPKAVRGCRRKARSVGRNSRAASRRGGPTGRTAGCRGTSPGGSEPFASVLFRTKQTGAGIPEAVRGCRGRKRRHPEKTDKQAAALLRLRKYDRSEAEFFRSREKPHPIQREQKCNGSLRIDRFS